MPEIDDILDGDAVISIISNTLQDIDDGEDLAEIFNDVCNLKIKYIGDNLFEVVGKDYEEGEE